MKVKQQRDFVMSVKLTPDMRDKLAFVSNSLGQAPATVASFAIGQYIATQHAHLNLVSNAINQLLPTIIEMLKEPETESESCSSSKECLEPPQPSAAEKIKKPTKSSRFGTSSKSKPSTGVD